MLEAGSSKLEAGRRSAGRDVRAINRDTTPKDVDYPVDLDAAIRDFKRAHILKMIDQCDGNKRMAAKMLGIGATSLYRKLGDPEVEVAAED